MRESYFKNKKSYQKFLFLILVFLCLQNCINKSPFLTGYLCHSALEPDQDIFPKNYNTCDAVSGREGALEKYVQDSQ